MSPTNTKVAFGCEHAQEHTLQILFMSTTSASAAWSHTPHDPPSDCILRLYSFTRKTAWRKIFLTSTASDLSTVGCPRHRWNAGVQLQADESRLKLIQSPYTSHYSCSDTTDVWLCSPIYCAIMVPKKMEAALLSEHACLIPVKQSYAFACLWSVRRS